MRHERNRTYMTAIIFLLILGLCTACGAGDTDEIPASQDSQGQINAVTNEAENTPEAAASTTRPAIDYDNPDLDGIIWQVTDHGMSVLQSEVTEENGVSLGVFRLEMAEENTISVVYTADVRFQKRSVELATYNSTTSDLEPTALQEDRTVYLWGEWSDALFYAHTVEMLEFI